MTMLAQLLRENRFTPEAVAPFEQKLFFEGAQRRAALVRFGVLLFLSVVIATAGILGDSTATVIGAMIIAPLMTPIMATTAALVTGRMDRAVRSLLLVGAGVGSVIALAWLLGTIYSGVLSFDSNSQITSRIHPRVVDLIAALASGAAGAFCMSREDIADSLPGVAIAISLVPPLCVVGVSLAYAEWDAAGGALLLFVTNMLAILLAGGATLAALGLSGAATQELRGSARRNAFIAITVAVALVTVPLATTGLALSSEVREQQRVRQITEDWVAETDYVVRSVQVKGDRVDVVISGSGETQPFATLVAAIERVAQRPVTIELEMVPSQRQRTPGVRSGASR